MTYYMETKIPFSRIGTSMSLGSPGSAVSPWLDILDVIDKVNYLLERKIL